MKTIRFVFAVFMLHFSFCAFGQIDSAVTLIQMELRSKSPNLRALQNIKTKDRSFPKKRQKFGPDVVKNDWLLHERVNPNALPKGEDPIRQKGYRSSFKNNSLLSSWEGIGYQNTNPADPTIAVGPNHVVQMVNNSDGAILSVWDKSGNVLMSNLLLDNLSLINGAGDPIVIYDQLADRWILSEIADDENALVVCVSETSDPLGAYFIYSFGTPFFPDYPKYGLWPEAYVITTNEADGQALYALDREALLNGSSSVSNQRFTIPLFNTIGFQAATPVSFLGTNISEEEYDNYDPIFMRIADDGWDGVEFDRLEYFTLDLDFNNSSNSTLTDPELRPTAPFDTELCGFTSFACIPQPNTSTRLDPLREVLMNRVYFRRFDDYESIVCSHVTDVTGNDLTGVRWYELRRQNPNQDFQIYQQGTFSPDDDNRWMSSIGIDTSGNIGIVYNVSSDDVFPSVRFASRTVCDDLGILTSGEIEIVTGSASNLSNRYGDYNDIGIDPVSGNIWTTAMYNPGVLWSTRINEVALSQECSDVRATLLSEELVLCDVSSSISQLEIDYIGSFDDTLYLRLVDDSNLIDSIHISPDFITSSDTVVVYIENIVSLDTNIVLQFELFNDEELFIEELEVVFVDNVDDSILLIRPSDGLISSELLPLFNWRSIFSVDDYRLVIAEDSLFNSIHTDTIIGDTSYQLADQLDPLTNYYWAVQAEDICLNNIISTVSSFETIFDTIQCFSFINDDVTVIPNSQSRVSSLIHMPHNAPIVDVNIVSMAIDHTFVSDLFIELVSPEGIRVPLMSFVCNTENDVNIGFDAQSPRPNFTIPCPPTDGLTYQPTGNLNLYNNMLSEGDWELSVFDAFEQDGGAINSWEMEICVNTIESLCSDTLYLFQDPLEYQFSIAKKNIVNSSNMRNGLIYELVAGEEINFVENFEIEIGSTLEATVTENVNCVEPNFEND